jgi:hypothetical protein
MRNNEVFDTKLSNHNLFCKFSKWCNFGLYLTSTKKSFKQVMIKS